MGVDGRKSYPDQWQVPVGFIYGGYPRDWGVTISIGTFWDMYNEYILNGSRWSKKLPWSVARPCGLYIWGYPRDWGVTISIGTFWDMFYENHLFPIKSPTYGKFNADKGTVVADITPSSAVIVTPF